MGVEGKKKGALSRHAIHLSILINLHYGEYIMCRLRTFYECSDGTMGWAEIVLSYDEENLDWVVDTAIEAGRGVLTLINMQKT